VVKKVKSCVFISGNGTNLYSIIKSSRDYNFPIKIELIISNNNNAKGLVYAKKYNIPFKIFNSANQKIFEKKCLIELKKRKIGFLCLAGFMKILSNNFIKTFGYKIINIHPSLLPKFKGLNTHKRVLIKKEKYTGCTVHYVSSKLDSGNIIMQKKILIKKNETLKSLKKKVLVHEHKLYPEAIRCVFK
jgi:formyltetrahydrofolate-dependent phosphoribosylglycinamide formyltransferase